MSLRTFSGDCAAGRPFGGPDTSHAMACWANEFGWRFSIAAIPSEEPFSVFVGVDRSSMLLDADGVHVIAQGAAAGPRLDVRDRQSVGVARTQCTVKGDSGTSREISSLGVWRKHVQVFDHACVVQGAEHGVMYALRGGWRLNDLFVCREGQGVGWSEEPSEWKAVPVSEQALMMVVRLVRPGLNACRASAP